VYWEERVWGAAGYEENCENTQELVCLPWNRFRAANIGWSVFFDWLDRPWFITILALHIIALTTFIYDQVMEKGLRGFVEAVISMVAHSSYIS